MDAKSLSKALETAAQAISKDVDRMRTSHLKVVRKNGTGTIKEEKRKLAELKENYEKAKDCQLELLGALHRQYLADPEKGQAALRERSEYVAVIFEIMKHAGPPQ
ncbi:uncharacterized protein ARMOST_21197 [Armillaria ostoyae]|uniref:Uncharacterized protein n=1 Tax=Armillaria ostoyae TaxID=47428 RepID=A0A284S9F8_ARMOS|nr:uncharacterized protein ARMOST_21197 [Armillaria ostoyae]